MNHHSIGEWLFIIASALFGVGARLSVTFSKRQEEAKAAKEPPIPFTRGEIVAAVVSAPAMGIIGAGLGEGFGFGFGVSAGMAGFLGLAGPVMLLAFWDKVIEPLIGLIRPKGG